MTESYDEFASRANIPALSYHINVRVSSSVSSSSSSSSESDLSESEVESEVSEVIESEGITSDDETSDSSEATGSVSGSKTAAVDEEFADFEDLKRYAEKFLGCKLSNNKRTTTCPPKWMKDKYPGVTVHWTSGTLYCMRHKKDFEQNVPWAKTSCRCHLRYVLHSSDTWRIQKYGTEHNHELLQDECRRGISGIRHITNASHLEQDQIRTINAWFDSKTGEKCL
jgi:hypothetical protein